MSTKRLDKKHWKMVVVLLVTYDAMLLLCWAAMTWDWAVTNEDSQTA